MCADNSTSARPAQDLIVPTAFLRLETTCQRTHAVDRMIQRQISTAEVEDVLTKPDGLIKQSQDKVIVYKKVDARTDNTLAVVAVEQG